MNKQKDDETERDPVYEDDLWKAMDRIAELEKALWWIVKSCHVKVHRDTLFEEIHDHARAALLSKSMLPKIILDEPTTPPEQDK